MLLLVLWYATTALLSLSTSRNVRFLRMHHPLSNHQHTYSIVPQGVLSGLQITKHQIEQLKENCMQAVARKATNRAV